MIWSDPQIYTGGVHGPCLLICRHHPSPLLVGVCRWCVSVGVLCDSWAGWSLVGTTPLPFPSSSYWSANPSSVSGIADKVGNPSTRHEAAYP